MEYIQLRVAFNILIEIEFKMIDWKKLNDTIAYLCKVAFSLAFSFSLPMVNCDENDGNEKLSPQV